MRELKLFLKVSWIGENNFEVLDEAKMSTKRQKNQKASTKVFKFLCAITFTVTFSFYVFSLARNYFQTSVLASSAISLGSVLVFVLPVVLHKSTQCIFFLTIPQFFSKRGRTAIIAYTFFIAFNGPAANLMKNFNVLTDCMACGQDQLKMALHELVQAVKEPYYTIKEAVEKIIPVIEKVMEEIKQSLLDLKNRLLIVGKHTRNFNFCDRT